jgi:hypothetical protein
MLTIAFKTVGIVALLTIPTFAATAAPKTEKYLCVTDYAAGIIAKDGSFSAGAVSLPPEKQKFFVIVTDHSDIRAVSDACYSKEQMDALKSYVEPKDLEKDVLEKLKEASKSEEVYFSPNEYIQYCLMGYDANVNGQALSSSDGFRYRDYGGDRTFTLTVDGKFYWHELALGVGDSEFITRRRCEPVN